MEELSEYEQLRRRRVAQTNAHMAMFAPSSEYEQLRAVEYEQLSEISCQVEVDGVNVRSINDTFMASYHIRCMQCRKQLELTCLLKPGEQTDVVCHYCGYGLTYTVPEPRLLQAANTISRYVQAIRAREKLRRLRAAARERANAEAQAEAAKEWRASQEAAHRAWSLEYAAKVVEERRIFEERASKAKAEHEAREAIRISKARAARVEEACKKAEAEEANKEKERLAKLAADQKAQIDRAARVALKAQEKAAKKAAKNRPCPFKAEEERQAKQNEEERNQKQEAEKQEAKKQEVAHMTREEDRARKKAIQDEEDARVAVAEAQAWASKQVKKATRLAKNKMASPLEPIAKGTARCGGPLPGDNAGYIQPPQREHEWINVAMNAHSRVTEAALALREAEDTARAIKESLESATPSPSSKADPVHGVHNKRRGRRVCWYFARGTCRNGDACEFLHAAPKKSVRDQSTPETAPAATTNTSVPAPEPAPAATTNKKSVPAPETEPESNPYCVICFEGIKDQLCMPCKHLCICSECANPSLKLCPMCREPVAEIFKVFC